MSHTNSTHTYHSL